MNWTDILFLLIGAILALAGRKAWLWLDVALDKWLDGATIVLAPEGKAQELEQRLWGNG